MPRWEQDARARLEEAALALFAERGFDEVTVPEITARAGLTTRTFFRHFADKREVLFGDADQIPDLARELVTGAPADWTPLEVVAQRLPDLAVQVFEGRRDQLRVRKPIIAADAGLRERELAKMQRLAEELVAGFTERGVDPLTAQVVAQTAVAVTQVAIGRWLAADDDVPLTDHLQAAMVRLREVFSPVG